MHQMTGTMNAAIRMMFHNLVLPVIPSSTDSNTNFNP